MYIETYICFGVYTYCADQNVAIVTAMRPGYLLLEQPICCVVTVHIRLSPDTGYKSLLGLCKKKEKKKKCYYSSTSLLCPYTNYGFI